jgi:transposase
MPAPIRVLAELARRPFYSMPYYHLCSYTGLIPSTHSSGGITHHVSITKTGSKYLRWIMLECLHAHAHNQKNSNVTRFYHRLSKKKGSSKAAVAAASKLLKIIY